MFKTGKIFCHALNVLYEQRNVSLTENTNLRVAGKVYIGRVSKLKWKAYGNVNFWVEDLMCGSAAIFLD